MSAIKTLTKLIESNNIAKELDDKLLSSIGSDVIKGYETDVDSRREWEERNERWMKLAYQVMEQKSFPWPNAANVKYPLLTIAALQFQSRSSAALLNNDKPVKINVVGDDLDGSKCQKAERIEKHLSYQLLEEMEEWEDDQDKLLLVLPLVGNAFKKTYYSPSLGRNKSELVLPQDLVVNYFAKSVEQASRKTHILSYYTNEAEEFVRSGTWLEHDIESKRDERKYAVDITQGVSKPDDDTDTPADYLEQHCWLDLDEDGYKEPYVVTVHYGSGDVVRIAPRFSFDDVYFGPNDTVLRIKATEFFTNYIFIPDPNSGVYGLSFGILLGPLNDAVNTITNQLIDAGTMSNVPSGFLGRGIRLKAGDTRFRPGEWKVVNTPGDDLKANIVPLPIKEPSQVLFQLLTLLIDAGQKLTNTTDTLLGENPGQNQPGMTTMAVMEQGVKVLTSIHKRVYRSFKKELRKLFKLNQRYLPSNIYFSILDGNSSNVGKDDYNMEGLDIMPAADPNIISQTQKLNKANSLLQLVQLGTVNVGEVTKRMLEAQEQYGIETLMNVPPPQPDPVMQMEQANLEHQMKMDVVDRSLEEQKLQYQRLKDESTAILNMMKAEAVEKEYRLKAAEVQLRELRELVNSFNKSNLEGMKGAEPRRMVKS